MPVETKQNLIEVFCPSPLPEGYRRGHFEPMAMSTRKYIQESLLPDSTEADQRGNYHFTPEAYMVLQKVGQAVSTLTSYDNHLRLLELEDRERIAFARTLAESLVNHNGHLRFIAPVCPDYGSGETFYQSMGKGISSEARAAITASEILINTLPGLGFQPHIDILIANTEDDIPEIIKRCAEGNPRTYESMCQQSAASIREELSGNTSIDVFTFKDYLGNRFRLRQYFFERRIRELISKTRSERGDETLATQDQFLRDHVYKTANQRLLRHYQILGRNEHDYELTIRYMAQYAAIASICREIRVDEPNVLMNYQSPNRQFFNPSFNKHGELVHSILDQQIVVPVLGTVARR